MKCIFFILIAAFAVIVESSHSTKNRTRREIESCGVPKVATGLIVRGQNFPRGSFPWMVALIYTGSSPPKIFCAGTLISKTFVISGECFNNFLKKMLPIFLNFQLHIASSINTRQKNCCPEIFSHFSVCMT